MPGEPDVPDEAGYVEERRRTENVVLVPNLHPGSIDFGVEHDVLVRLHGAFRLARGPEGVDEVGRVLC